jgi:DNA-3-methyladenine glycosylase
MGIFMKRLERDFFEQSTLDVAQQLIGKSMMFENVQGVITETEAYVGQDDPACHAARGLTPRNAVMFGPAGHSYVYFIYGMYFCLNFVTEKEGFPAAVLIRGVFIKSPFEKHLNGPGKLCRDFGITKEHNGIDLTLSPQLYVLRESQPLPYITTPRIGIRVGTDKLWRFVADPRQI